MLDLFALTAYPDTFKNLANMSKLSIPQTSILLFALTLSFSVVRIPDSAARQAMLGRLLEVDRQGTYRFSDAERTQMLREYVQNVMRNGLACDANTCDNEKLKNSIQAQVRKLQPQETSPAEQKQFQQAVKRTTTVPKPSAAKPKRGPAVAPSSALPNSLKGYRVTYVKSGKMLNVSRTYVQEHILSFVLLWLSSALAGIVIGAARRRWVKQAVLQILPR